MALPQGINFRNTAGFDTDGANEDVETTATANYPRTSAQGNTVGWEQNLSGTANRNAALDARLAGVAFRTSVADVSRPNYRIDLPSTGDYKIGLAGGDANFANKSRIELFDTTSSLGVLVNAVPGAGSFLDATAAVYTAANWPASQALVTKTFATTICRFALGDTGVTTALAHVYVEAVAAAAGRIFKLAGFGGGLVGQAKGLAG